jgi:hypothetical protein
LGPINQIESMALFIVFIVFELMFEAVNDTLDGIHLSCVGHGGIAHRQVWGCDNIALSFSQAQSCCLPDRRCQVFLYGIEIQTI